MMTATQMEALRPFAFDLRTALVTETGEIIEAWSTVAPADPPVKAATFTLAVLSGSHRGEVFRVDFLACNRALGR